MDIDWLESEIARLAKRPKAEVGIPMFVVPENLAEATPDASPTDAGSTELSRSFDAAVAGLEKRRGPLKPEDLAAIIEVLAEHHFLDHPFSDLSS